MLLRSIYIPRVARVTRRDISLMRVNAKIHVYTLYHVVLSLRREHNHFFLYCKKFIVKLISQRFES